MASTWIVTFSLGWDPLFREERQELEHHFSTVPVGSGGSECWEVRVRSDTAAAAVHEVSLMLGLDRQRRLVQISAAQDLAERVRAATPWRS